MKRALAIHPFLFALYPVLFPDALPPAAAPLSAALLLTFAFNLFFRNAARSGIAATAFMVLFLACGRTDKALKHFRRAPAIDPGLAPARNNLNRARAIRAKEQLPDGS